MDIKRDSYLQQLIFYRFDGLVKVITGIRRCGKSYLLKNIYRDYLLEEEVKAEQILDLLCASISSLTNLPKIADTLRLKQIKAVSANTIRAYIGPWRMPLYYVSGVERSFKR